MVQETASCTCRAGTTTGSSSMSSTEDLLSSRDFVVMTLKVTCTMDNTDDNPFLQEYLGGAVAGGVKLGDGTAEEMCLVAVGLACEGLCPD